MNDGLHGGESEKQDIDAQEDRESALRVEMVRFVPFDQGHNSHKRNQMNQSDEDY